jgi:gas vesicle protein
MKTVTEMRDVAKERSDDMAATSKKAAYAVMGAPVVTGRRIADYAGKVGKSLQKEFEAWVAEGERLSGEVSETKMVSEIKERVDFENLQGRVEKLKDQLEDVLTNWKDTFKPGEGKTEAEETKEAAEEPKPAKKATAAPEAAAESDDS